jgi:hypothetical protein
MASELTTVSIAWRKRRRNHRLIFGAPYRWVRLDWRRRLAAFTPGQIFAYERWRANKYGTQSWQIFVVKAGRHKTCVQRIPGVFPGAELLLAAYGSTASKRLLKCFDQLGKTEPLERISEHRWKQISYLKEAGLWPLAVHNMEAI